MITNPKWPWYNIISTGAVVTFIFWAGATYRQQQYIVDLLDRLSVVVAALQIEQAGDKQRLNERSKRNDERFEDIARRLAKLEQTVLR